MAGQQQICSQLDGGAADRAVLALAAAIYSYAVAKLVRMHSTAASAAAAGGVTAGASAVVEVCWFLQQLCGAAVLRIRCNQARS